jgi:uncharacterized membrane protein YecN with MAPEG domain
VRSDGRQRLTPRILFGKDLDRLSARRRLKFDLAGIVLVVVLVVVFDMAFNGGESLTVPLVLGPILTLAAFIRYWTAWPP